MLQPSGYVVMRPGPRLHLVADVGPPCPPELPAHAHADCLSFELAVDGQRTVVDTGTSTYAPGERRQYERSTRAHNTVEVDGADQSEVWGDVPGRPPGPAHPAPGGRRRRRADRGHRLPRRLPAAAGPPRPHPHLAGQRPTGRDRRRGRRGGATPPGRCTAVRTPAPSVGRRRRGRRSTVAVPTGDRRVDRPSRPVELARPASAPVEPGHAVEWLVERSLPVELHTRLQLVTRQRRSRQRPAASDRPRPMESRAVKQVVQSAPGGPVRVVDVPRPDHRPHRGAGAAPSPALMSPGTERAVTALAQSSLLAKARARPDLVRQVREEGPQRGRGAGGPGGAHPARRRHAPRLLGRRHRHRGGRGGGRHRPRAAGRHRRGGQGQPRRVPGRARAAVRGRARRRARRRRRLRHHRLGGPARLAAGRGRARAPRWWSSGWAWSASSACGWPRPQGATWPASTWARLRSSGPGRSGAFGLVEAGVDTTKAILEWSRGRGADAVLLMAATKSSSVIARTPELCRDGANVVVVGDVGLELDRRPFYERELTMRFARSYGPGRYERELRGLGRRLPPWPGALDARAATSRRSSTCWRRAASWSTTWSPTASPSPTRPTAYELVETGERALRRHRLRLPRPASWRRQAHRAAACRRGRGRRASPGSGLIGAGAFASTVLVPALQGGRVRPASCRSRRRRGCRPAAWPSGPDSSEPCPGADAVIDDPDVDVVVIATPHDTHAALVARALRAGKHVFCEKPLALTIEELDDVEAAWQRARRRPLRRLQPPLVRSGATGHGDSSPARPGPLVITYRVSAGHAAGDALVPRPPPGRPTSRRGLPLRRYLRRDRRGCGGRGAGDGEREGGAAAQ